MKRLSAKNYEYNKAIPLPQGPINGQSLGTVSGMRFGCSTMSYSGCEVIAVYNALWLAGCPQPFDEIARYMERFRMMRGFWGTNFLALGRCLKRFGLRAKRVRRRKRVEVALQNGQTCLFVYWTRRRFCSPVHTICIQQNADSSVSAYNYYGNSLEAARFPVEDLLRKRLIVAYLIEERR